MISPLLSDGDRILVPPLVLFALYLLMAGHNRPGGGFVAGLTVAAAVVLRAQARSVDDALRLLPLDPVTLLAVGLGTSVLVALAPLAAGGGVLDQPFTTVVLPVFGDVKLTAAFVFDIGVAALVVGVVAAVLDAFGDIAQPSPELQVHTEADGPRLDLDDGGTVAAPRSRGDSGDGEVRS